MYIYMYIYIYIYMYIHGLVLKPQPDLKVQARERAGLAKTSGQILGTLILGFSGI